MTRSLAAPAREAKPRPKEEGWLVAAYEGGSNGCKHPSGQPVVAPATDADIVAGRYRISDALGRGGMGRVFRAHDDLLDRDVALKLIYAEALADEELSRECAEEARVVANVAHPGVARVLDSGIDDGRCFVVSELVEGQTLSTLLAEQAPLPAERST